MGLLGLAKRAAKEQAEYDYNENMYNRRRQRWQDRMTHQRFKNKLEDRTRKNAWNDELQARKRTEWKQEDEDRNRNNAWNKEAREHTRQTWEWDKEDRKDDRAWMNETRGRTRQNWKYEDANREAAKKFLEQYTIPAAEHDKYMREQQRDAANKKAEAVANMSPEERNAYYLGIPYGSSNSNSPSPNGRNWGKNSAPGGTSSASAGSEKQTENVAKSITPEFMRDVFRKEFGDLDDKYIERKSGRKSDDLYRGLSEAYAFHVRTQGQNALSPEEFVRRQGIPIRSKYNLSKLMKAKAHDRVTGRKGHSYFRPNSKEYEYEKKYGSSLYNFQKNLHDEIVRGAGEAAGQYLRDENSLRDYHKARLNGATPDQAFYSLLQKKHPQILKECGEDAVTYLKMRTFANHYYASRKNNKNPNEAVEEAKRKAAMNELGQFKINKKYLEHDKFIRYYISNRLEYNMSIEKALDFAKTMCDV